jgi:hypothetical protein
MQGPGTKSVGDKLQHRQKDQSEWVHISVLPRMFSGNWRSELALGFITPFVVLGFLMAIGPSPSNVSRTGETDYGYGEQRSAQNDAPKNAYLPDSPENEAYCKHGKEEKDRKDCIISLRNAKAAERQALLSLVSLVATAVAILISAGGLLLLKYTLHATRDAVAEAETTAKAAQASVRQAARAARQQSAHMRRSLSLSEKAVRVQSASERPHLMLTELKASGLQGAPNSEGQVELTLNYQFQNFGKSPAFLKGVANKLGWDLGEAPTYPEPSKVPHMVAPVTGLYWRPPMGGLFLPKAVADGAVAGEVRLYFYGLLSYEGVLREPHVIRYCYQLVFQGNDATIAFRPGGPASYWEYT